MRQTMAAVFVNGVFKPLNTPELSEGQYVRLEIETPRQESPDDLLELAAKVYEGLSDEEIDAVERIANDRGGFFGNRKQFSVRVGTAMESSNPGYQT